MANIADELTKNINELRQGLERHGALVASLLDSPAGEGLTRPPSQVPASRPSDAPLKQALIEAIEVLEQSRKAFKSKRLEALRKKLTQVLINTP